MSRLNGKVAIITGAASGIGLSTVEIFAAEGATVIATDVSEGALNRAVEAVTATGGNVVARTLDVSSPESWQRVVNDVVTEWGTIDILVNNAGIAIPKGILEAELEDWNKVLAINATGTWLGMKNVLPVMQAAGRGSIVNVSSLAAIISGAADGGGAAYSASKGAVRSLTKHGAQWFAKDHIRVNSVHPGPIYTSLIQNYGITKEQAADPLNVTLPPHIGEASDIAYGILYLASDEAKFVTGEELIIDGGFATH
ncbi:glucose 1-dehydrogenase [Arthrobacter sp. NicSoilB8]|uniref:SDR family NAD(P)-dependent oxidoreductase n=1 Tax=Arthrobacter sp. NicSoilB8 TaxID=2830998 RepID=UPI001CC7C184|nr:glucose 1-dehydrogenase [Arthrobacter sp. NicSoilB8]BCW70707.1 2,5-dichloro-2,5-cyclohexadiene-1,4-diol dehydrogenase [Arthrobacter sp. NicSoilB8]